MDQMADLYQQFDPLRALTAASHADRALYVDWQRELAGDDVKVRLARSIAWCGDGATVHLLTGTRGVGKTTELHRVKHLLEDGTSGKRFFVSMLMAEDRLDLADVQAEEISIEIVRQLVSDLRGAGFRPGSVVGEFFRKLGADFNKRLNLDAVEVGVDPLHFTFKYENVPYGRRREFRELLQGQLPRIYDLVNEKILKDARAPG